MKKSIITIAVLGLIMIGMSTAAVAQPLPFSGTIFPTADGSASSPGGTQLAYLSHSLVGMAGTKTIWTGTFEQWVRQSTNAGMGLVFEYRISNTSVAPVTGLMTLEDVSFWDGFITNADVYGPQPDVLITLPDSIQRSTSGLISNIAARWNTSGIGPAQNSGLLWIETNANLYDMNGWTSIQGQTGQDQFATYAPTSTPEPATMVLFGLGMFGVGARALKRKKFKA